jgi:hypothetical protein
MVNTIGVGIVVGVAVGVSVGVGVIVGVAVGVSVGRLLGSGVAVAGGRFGLVASIGSSIIVPSVPGAGTCIGTSPVY